MEAVKRLNAAGFRIEITGAPHVVHLLDIWDRRLVLFYLKNPNDERELGLVVDAFLAGRRTVLNELGVEAERKIK